MPLCVSLLRLQYPAPTLRAMPWPRWLIEELRVSLFAQVVKTSVSISTKRLDKFLEDIREP